MEYRHLRAPLMVVGVALLVVAAGSWIAFPGWTASPASIIILISMAAAGVVAFLRNLSGFLKDYRDLNSRGLAMTVTPTSSAETPLVSSTSQTGVSNTSSPLGLPAVGLSATKPRARAEILRSKQPTTEVNVLLVTTGQTYRVRIPMDMVVGHLTSSIAELVGLPDKAGLGGPPIHYLVFNQTRGAVLPSDLTFRQTGLRRGDTLTLRGEFAAG